MEFLVNGDILKFLYFFEYSGNTVIIEWTQIFTSLQHFFYAAKLYKILSKKSPFYSSRENDGAYEILPTLLFCQKQLYAKICL